jgi:hypothetical protein
MHTTVTRASAIALTMVLPAHLLADFAAGTGIFALLVYAGIALPAVWSAKPARRKAAAEVLGQILDTFRQVRTVTDRSSTQVRQGSRCTQRPQIRGNKPGYHRSKPI